MKIEEIVSAVDDLKKVKTLKAMREALSMTIQRCYNPKQRDYRRYGARGIVVCERWLESFDNFLEDMGLRPDGHTLERLNNDGNYTKDNCVWASRKEQTRNRESTLKLTYKGETKSLVEWSELTSIPYDTLKARKTRLGYSDYECIEKPVKPGGKLEGRSYKPHKGLESKKTRLTAKDVFEIRKEIDNGVPRAVLATRFGVSVTTVTNAYKGVAVYAETIKAD